MLDQIVAAIKRQDYRTATQLVQQFLATSPHNPWGQLYLGQLHEVAGELSAAENVYRQLLRTTANTQILTQAREGVQRVQVLLQQQRTAAIAQATSDPSNTQIGVLILEPVTTEKGAIAQKFAQIMQIDAYTARLQLPTRGWRLYKSGKIGELRFFGEQLRDAGVPCFWATLADVEAIKVFQVSYFQSLNPLTVVCQNEHAQIGSLTFNSSEVSQRVTGLLPIFEQVVDRDVRGKLQRKTQTQDYVQLCDLHLPARNCILRLQDQTYQYLQGITVAQQSNQTSRLNWNSLTNFLYHQFPQAPVWGDFTAFAPTVLDQTEMLRRLRSHIHLLRKIETPWDPAFHLYSGLVFLKNATNKD